jgi:hypothetical protein
MADKNFDIRFKTTADTQGAKQTAEAIREVEVETNRLTAAEQKRSIFATAPDRAHEAQMAKDLAYVKDKAGMRATFQEAAVTLGSGGGIGNAAQVILQNQAATASVKELAAGAGATLGAVAAVYGTMTYTFGGVKKQFDELAAVYPKFAEENKYLGVTLATLANPFKTACEQIKDGFTGVTSWIGQKFDQIVLNGSIAAIKSAVQSAKMAADMKAAYEAAAAAHKLATDKKLADMARELEAFLQKEAAMDAHRAMSAAKIQAASDAAARAAEVAGGATPGELAVSDLARQKSAATAAESAAQAKVDEAYRRGDSQAIGMAEIDLDTLMKENAIKLSAAAKAAVETQNADFVANLNEAVSQIEAGTEGTAAAKAAVLQATADGKLTADELLAMSGNMTALIGGLQTGMATTNGNLSQLLRVMFSYQAGMDSHSATISQLQRNLTAMLNRVTELERNAGK